MGKKRISKKTTSTSKKSKNRASTKHSFLKDLGAGDIEKNIKKWAGKVQNKFKHLTPAQKRASIQAAIVLATIVLPKSKVIKRVFKQVVGKGA